MTTANSANAAYFDALRTAAGELAASLAELRANCRRDIAAAALDPDGFDC